MEQFIIIDILGLLTYLLFIVLHEIGHYIAYKLIGIENSLILWQKMCVVIKDINFIQVYVTFFNSKKESAWKNQIIMSLSGLIFNVFLAIGWTVSYMLYQSEITSSSTHILFIGIIVWQYISILLNCIPEISDGKKIFYALKHKERYYLFFEHEYIQKKKVVKRITEIKKYLQKHVNCNY